MLMQNFGVTNKEYYGRLWYFLEWSIEFFSQRIYVKIEFSSQRREILLFFTTNMAAVTSHANQQK